ncbi:gluconokinase [Saccharopolyspora gloriosae]|uniref:gluconokinase n=1 Tax=Saccharopolyspora gloriosae TaxID=455344 RepID=UPI001FB7A17C|nr:gluconokinase, GntK/IdnK-type [Saccharopolyspora gloriosae]
MVILVMGVGGCGKTTLGRRLADVIRGKFIDGDDHHTATAIEKMRSGMALDDNDRVPWLREINAISQRHVDRTVIACSALKQCYRDILRSNVPMVFIHLIVSEGLARNRLDTRASHFFPPSLVHSQFETLELLKSDEQGITLNGALEVSELVAEACTYLERHTSLWTVNGSTTSSSSTQTEGGVR